MIALTPKVIPWCCSDDSKLDDRSKRTYWLLGSIDEEGMVGINDQVSIHMRRDGTFATSNGTRIYLYVKRGLRGMEEGSKFLDEKGKEVPFETGDDGLVTDAYLERIPWTVKEEMCETIVKGLKMEEEEKEE